MKKIVSVSTGGEEKILRNSIYNLLGWLLPVIVNFLTIPFIVRMMGNDSYGILMLSTAIIGYFSLMDINLTAGSVRYIAEYYAKGEEKKVNEVLSFSLMCYMAIGLLGAFFLYSAVDIFLMDLLKIPDDLENVTRTVFHLASIGFFLSIIQNYLGSIPGSIHRFDVSAKIEAGFGLALMVLTVVLLYFGYGLLEVVILRLIILFFNCTTLFVMVKKVIPYSRFVSKIRWATMRDLATFSGYSFMSKVSARITANTDRLVIGAIISSAAVTLYVVPYMLVSRLMNISYRLSMVLFPVASEMGALNKREDLKDIYIVMNRHIFFLNIALTTVICLFSKQILQLWMGDEFAQQTYIILILISLAFFVDTLTNLPSLLNDGLSYPHVTGFFALARAVLGFLAVIIGAKLLGVIGVAAAYLVSSVIIGAAFFRYVHKKTIKISVRILVKESFLKSSVFSLVIVFLMLLIKPLLPLTTPMIIIQLFIVTIFFTVFGYKIILNDDSRTRITSLFS